MRHPSLIALSHDHHHGLALALRCRKQALGQIKPMGTPGLRERAEEAMAFYESNLIAHFRAEEEVLFPSIGELVAQTGPLIEKLLREHAEIGQAVTQLKRSTGLAKLIFDFGDLLERHIRAEERQLFPLFEQHVPGDQAERIGAELKKTLERKASS
jgi:iron-sulfur cluster repair protein YtfE (RIC family)